MADNAALARVVAAALVFLDKIDRAGKGDGADIFFDFLGRQLKKVVLIVAHIEVAVSRCCRRCFANPALTKRT